MHFIRTSLLLFCVFLGVGSASAQLVVTLDFEESKYVRYQEITATVTIMNRSGRDFILEGANGESWLSFKVINPENRIVPKRGNAPRVAPLMVRKGETVRRSIPLSLLYKFDAYGDYGVTAFAYYGPSDDYIGAPRKRVTITDGSVFWEEVVGFETGENQPLKYRTISLLIHKDYQRARLFMRVAEKDSERVLGTRYLGRILAFKDPQVTIDAENRIHVLFLSAPKTWLHTIALPDGSVLKPEIFREDGANRPYMMLSRAGRVSIHGGFFKGGSEALGGVAVNPAEVRAIAAGNAPNARRSLSDRPGTTITNVSSSVLPDDDDTLSLMGLPGREDPIPVPHPDIPRANVVE